MADVSFKLVDVEKKPSRRYRKGSKYDPIIDQFCNSKSTLVKVDIKEKDANYIRTQLKKRIDARDMGSQIEVSVVNNIAYIEKK
jgi:hypothetical protein